MLAALGLAIDLSMLYGHLQMAQSAADGAAQAGALSLFRGTNATGPNSFAVSTPASQYSCSTTDGTVPCAFARMNGFGSSTDDTVTVSFPQALTGVNLAGGNAAVSVSVHRNVGAMFLRLVGGSALPVTRVATAALVKLPLANCITSLNSSVNDALHVAGNGNVNLTGCGIAVNSASSSAFTVAGNGSVRADAISVVGGAPPPAGNGTVSPTPTTHVAPMSDPLLTVPVPNYSSHCDQTNESISNGTVRLTPGTYCNGIAISGHGQVTMDPGTYVLLGGGLSVTGSNASLAGSNVTFYNTFDASHTYTPIVLSGGATVNLSASSGGPLAGMLFFQDRGAPLGSAQSFAGNPSVTLTGSLYFPRSAVSFAGNPSLTLNVAIVGDTISWTGQGYLTENLAQSGAPQQKRVALVE